MPGVRQDALVCGSVIVSLSSWADYRRRNPGRVVASRWVGDDVVVWVEVRDGRNQNEAGALLSRVRGTDGSQEAEAAPGLVAVLGM